MSLFSGAAIVGLGALLAAFVKPRRGRLAGRLMAMAGVLLMFLSSTPFPPWVYILLLLMAAGWLALTSLISSQRSHALPSCQITLPAFCLALAVFELPYQWMPQLPSVRPDRLVVIGDSLSAGIDEHVPNWPTLLAERSRISVLNLAVAGATLSTARKQASQVPDGDCLVLLEIGGNDLLGTPTPAGFEQDLKELLSLVCKPGRKVIMLELPLLPFQSTYGRIQRRLATEHGVYLIPKRHLARVLGTPAATTDGLHLSAEGNRRLARILEPAMNDLFAKRTKQ